MRCAGRGSAGLGAAGQAAARGLHLHRQAWPAHHLDRPIADCVDREQRVLDHTGTERRRIGPSLTEHERAAQEAAPASRPRRAPASPRSAGASAALTARYPDESHAPGRAQCGAGSGGRGCRRGAQTRAVAEGRTQAAGRGAEFYRGDVTKAPVLLQRQIADNEQAWPTSSAFWPPRSWRSAASTNASMPSWRSCASCGRRSAPRPPNGGSCRHGKIKAPCRSLYF